MNAPAAAVNRAESGWSAHLEMGFRAQSGRTILAERRRQGPLSVQRPFYPEGEVCHVYLLHPPGGVVGGDSLQIAAGLAPGSHALVTTPGAAKFYRSAGAMACQKQRLRVCDGARLEWLPQENILFPGARVTSSTRIDLEGGAGLALWEIHCLGRPAIGEVFDDGSLDAGLEVWRDGLPLLNERLRVHPGNRLRRSMLGGRAVTATALFSGAGADHLELIRQLIDDGGHTDAAVTLLGDLLVLRCLDESTARARHLLIAAWNRLREPLYCKPAIVPRIWNT